MIHCKAMKPRATAVDPKMLCRSGVSSVPVPVPMPEEKWEGSPRINFPPLVEYVCEEMFYWRKTGHGHGHGHGHDEELSSKACPPVRGAS